MLFFVNSVTRKCDYMILGHYVFVESQDSYKGQKALLESPWQHGTTHQDGRCMRFAYYMEYCGSLKVKLRVGGEFLLY